MVRPARPGFRQTEDDIEKAVERKVADQTRAIEEKNITGLQAILDQKFEEERERQA